MLRDFPSRMPGKAPRNTASPTQSENPAVVEDRSRGLPDSAPDSDT